MLSISPFHMPRRDTQPADNPLEYIWSLAHQCYLAQVSLWRREGEALAASDPDSAEKLRDYQIALYSSSIQIHTAELALRRNDPPDTSIITALRCADADVRLSVEKMSTLETACEGAEMLINALHELESASDGDETLV